MSARQGMRLLLFCLCITTSRSFIAQPASRCITRLAQANSYAKIQSFTRVLQTKPMPLRARYEDTDRYQGEKRRAFIAAILSPLIGIGSVYAILPLIFNSAQRNQVCYCLWMRGWHACTIHMPLTCILKCMLWRCRAGTRRGSLKECR